MTNAHSESLLSVADRAQPIYLDNAATTPVDPAVAAAMIRHLGHREGFGNPSSQGHDYGWSAHESIEEARVQLATLIGSSPEELIWTSGATESNNLALKGAALAHRDRGRHIVTTAIEHKSVLAACHWLERQGFEVEYLRPGQDGAIEPEMLAKSVRRDTIICSVHYANNEIGVLQDLPALAEVVRKTGALFHVDAAQAAGKIPLDVEEMGIDLASLSAHKIYGPKGIGALYVRRRPRVRLEAQIHGGGQELGMRSGTLATHQIVGMGTACAVAGVQMEEEHTRLASLRDVLWEGLRAIGGVRLNGHEKRRLPGILNVSVEEVNGRELLSALEGLAVSSGSACASSTLEPSYVLLALGLEEGLAHASIRFSLGRFTSEEDIGQAVVLARDGICALRSGLRIG